MTLEMVMLLRSQLYGWKPQITTSLGGSTLYSLDILVGQSMVLIEHF